jgi:hypothetical protein
MTGSLGGEGPGGGSGGGVTSSSPSAAVWESVVHDLAAMFGVPLLLP